MAELYVPRLRTHYEDVVRAGTHTGVALARVLQRAGGVTVAVARIK